MIEDDAYRTSSQYRYWSYTRETLASLRQDTNRLASERVRAAIRRARDAKKPNDAVENGVGKMDPHNSDNTGIDTLTVQEELKIVSWFSSKIIEVGGAMEPPIPMEIRVLQLYILPVKAALTTQMLTAFYSVLLFNTCGVSTSQTHP
jgi:cyclin H